MSKPSPACSCTTNWYSCSASPRKRGSQLPWLDKGGDLARAVGWHARSACGVPGCRDPVLPDDRGFVQAAARQTTGMVASLLKLAGLDRDVSDGTTLCCRQKTRAVQTAIGASTGIKVLG